MPTLTELQKERISFHLEFVRSEYFLAIQADQILITLNTSQKLALVGPDVLDPLNTYTFEGVDLCSLSSALGKCELALSKLGAETIEESLYVSQAGSVSLRGNELNLREKLYLNTVKYLNQLVGEGGKKSRVGW